MMIKSRMGQLGHVVCMAEMRNAFGRSRHRWVLKKLDVRVWNGFYWIRVGFSGEITFRFHSKGREFLD
jgi:hypothetical protein